ncbi:lactosylceramide 1,3-N-acetyl-beta-D-glucosaminyltransferase isoform X2 [Sus scrofa]|uniref:lactosylceramide 1,3-N-acetyl-beta-D-glucosaminyltransferase isoform X2 n=1 Tax=Sus scrofa TaxID=9823 RepID=UPI000A2B9952|nr:lactosylceramide 1,3-N-acetyl-beta-D-glucosaminyltransferase isoform X2 [Sus scrofa]
MLHTAHQPSRAPALRPEPLIGSAKTCPFQPVPRWGSERSAGRPAPAHDLKRASFVPEINDSLRCRKESRPPFWEFKELMLVLVQIPGCTRTFSSSVVDHTATSLKPFWHPAMAYYTEVKSSAKSEEDRPRETGEDLAWLVALNFHKKKYTE